MKNTHPLAFFLTLTLLFHSSANAAGSDSKLKRDAQAGKAQAQLEYGLELKQKATMMEFPEGVKGYDDPKAAAYRAKQDKAIEEALEWVRKAADQNLVEAWMTLYYLSYDETKKGLYLEKAAALKHPEAFNHLVSLYASAQDRKVGFPKAQKWGEKAKQLKIDLSPDSQTVLMAIGRCLSAGSPSIPAAEMPSPETQKLYKRVNCTNFRISDSEATDWKKYKDCVLTPEADSPAFGDIELFANGWGVKRNPDLALSLACKLEPLGASQISQMIEVLGKTKKDLILQETFIACNFSYDNASINSCAAISNEFNENKRKFKLSSFTDSWSEADKKAFHHLQEVADAYFDFHSYYERDRDGSMAPRVAGAESESLKVRFLTSVKEFEAGKYPKKYDLKVADKNLNEQYQRMMKDERKGNKEGTLVTNENIRDAQRKWIKYRDAWVGFVKKKYPKESSDLWNAWLTKERHVLLRQIEGR